MRNVGVIQDPEVLATPVQAEGFILDPAEDSILVQVVGFTPDRVEVFTLGRGAACIPAPVEVSIQVRVAVDFGNSPLFLRAPVPILGHHIPPGSTDTAALG